MQSIVEPLNTRSEPTIISLDVLLTLKQEALSQSSASLLDIVGLKPERAPTFAAGVAILQALFELLNIVKLHLLVAIYVKALCFNWLSVQSELSHFLSIDYNGYLNPL